MRFFVCWDIGDRQPVSFSSALLVVFHIEIGSRLFPCLQGCARLVNTRLACRCVRSFLRFMSRCKVLPSAFADSPFIMAFAVCLFASCFLIAPWMWTAILAGGIAVVRFGGVFL